MPLFGLPDIEKLTQRRDVEGIIKALGHNNEAVREEAAFALGELKDLRAVGPLVKLAR